MDVMAELAAATPRVDPFRPSEYTGLLLEAVQQIPFLPADAAAAEIGVGSGVVLASIGLRGAAALRGVDCDPDAIRAATALMERTGLADRARLSLGDVWKPLPGERFDLIVANLPQFPSNQPTDADRSPCWGTGGRDGRRLMDPFLAGLGAHLRPGGMALITHSTIVGLARTRDVLAEQGLHCTSLIATQVLLQPGKAALLPPEAWAAGREAGLLEIGSYRYIEAHILRIAAA